MPDKLSIKESKPIISLSTGVFLVFLFLKLTEIGQVTTWSWWWVTSPLWIPLAIVVIIMIVVVIVLLLSQELYQQYQMKHIHKDLLVREIN